MQGFAGPELFVELYRPCTIHRAVQALYYIPKAVQAQHYTQGCVGPTLNERLYRPCSIGSAVQNLHYTKGFVGPVLYV